MGGRDRTPTSGEEAFVMNLCHCHDPVVVWLGQR